ncbi:MAG: sigma 54-interacting transcriptional regulator [Myxococcota bacterium]
MRKLTHTIVDEPRTAQSGAGVPPRALRIVDSPDATAVDRLITVTRTLTVGRAGGDAELTVADSRISGQHFRLHAGRSGLLEFEDAGSRNGTFHNGVASASGSLALGDVLRFGATSAVVTRRSDEPDCEDPDEGIIGVAPVFREACARALETAHADLTVLLLGETGVGKEVFASLVHRASARRGSFVPVNCTAIPEQLADAAFFGHEKGAFTGASQSRIGYFREAEGGTLFLDEVGDLPAMLQPRLLRALEQKEVAPVGATRPVPVNVRIVAATNADLEAAVAEGRFRPDLYARLRDWTVELPPLRERREDILRLARHFLAAKPGSGLLFEPDVVEACLLYTWPFNVRELRQVMRGLAAIRSGPPYKFSQLPDFLRGWRHGPPVKGPRTGSGRAFAVDSRPPREGRSRHVPREEFVAAMHEHGHNVSAVARHFGRDRKQIYRWIERYGVERGSESDDSTR